MARDWLTTPRQIDSALTTVRHYTAARRLLMTSNRELVYLNGTLQGNGQSASCRVQCLAVRSASGPTTYTQYRILSVSLALAQGDYELLVDGVSLKMRHFNGFWLSGFTYS
jgi:hypothetical protein